MTWPAVKRGFTQEQFAIYAASLAWLVWRPSKIVFHNTALPSLAQWIKSAADDKAKNLQPGITRINNLERFFKDENHWSGAPHLFIAPDVIWVFNPLTSPGVHSPSFNATSIGIEMIGDFSKEDDEFGDGLKVKRNTVFATAVLCSALGLEPTNGEIDQKTYKTSGTIFLHKQDPNTTHDCPGVNIARDKISMIESVRALMAGGEHNDGEFQNKRIVVTTTGGLNIRKGPGVLNPVVKVLQKGEKLAVIGEAKNGSTTWLNCEFGWVSALYVKDT